MDRVSFLSLHEISDLNTLVQQHEEILNALYNKDIDRASILLDTHFKAVLKAMRRLSEQYEQYFED